jgi:membrane-bound lytic murein transglycosylase D
LLCKVAFYINFFQMKTLILPILLLVVTNTLAHAQIASKPDAINTATTHTVNYGDNIYSIAKKYNLSPNDLLHWNKLHKGATLDRGQVLLLAPPPTSALGNAAQNKTMAMPADRLHHVKYGEYPYQIAKKYNISPNHLLSWNQLNEDARLDYGDRLWLVNPNEKAETAEVAEQTSVYAPIPENAQHEVKQGDTIYSIAQKYGLTPTNLMKWNQLLVSSDLEIGKKLWLKQQ